MSSDPQDWDSPAQIFSKASVESLVEPDEVPGTNGTPRTETRPRRLLPHPTPRSQADGAIESGKKARLAGPSSGTHPRRTYRSEFIPLLPAASAPHRLGDASGRNSAPARAQHTTPRVPLLAAMSEPFRRSSRPALVPGWNTAPTGERQTTPNQQQFIRPRQYFPFRHPQGAAPEQPTPLKPFLLGLPIECRYRIYKLLLIEDASLQLTTKRGLPTYKTPALLHVNRQIREEASHIYYGSNHFVLTVKHGEVALVHSFLLSIASLKTLIPVRLDIMLSTCFQCNDLVGAAAVLISCNIRARIKCARSLYHVGHPQVMPCKYNIPQTIMDQNFRPSVATALLRCSNQQFPGAGFVIEEPPAETLLTNSTSTTAMKESAVLGYTPTYNINMSIRKELENAMGSVGLLLQ